MGCAAEEFAYTLGPLDVAFEGEREGTKESRNNGGGKKKSKEKGMTMRERKALAGHHDR